MTTMPLYGENRPAAMWSGKARGGSSSLVRALIAAVLFLAAVQPDVFAQDRDSEMAPDQRQILILHSYYPTYQWTSSITQGIRDVFDHSAFADSRFLFEYLDTKRYPDRDYMRYVAQVLRVKYGGRSDIDLIVSCDDQALHFLLEEARDLFPNVPVVFCGVNDYSPELRTRGRPLTGVCEIVDVNRNVALIPELCPWVRRVLVVTDPHTRTSLVLRGELAAAFRRKTPDLEVRFTGDVTPEELAARVGGLGRDTVVFLLLFSRDENGRDYTHEEAISMLSSACPVPVFGLWDTYLGLGIVGGLLTSPEVEGRRAAELALRVLEGEQASEIPVVRQPANAYMFDWRQLRRFGIDEGSLPATSVVVNREPSFMGRYWGWLVLAVAVIVFESMLIAALLIQRTNLRQAQRTLQESESTLRHVLDLVPHYIHARDASGRFLLANQAVADAVGRPLRDVVGRAYTDFAPESAEAEDTLADDAELLRSGETRLAADERFTDAAGDVHWLTTFKRPFEWRGCQALLVCSVDVTEKRELEDQLRQSQKMEAVGRLAGGVAHDFNNLLQVIRGYAPLLKRDYAHDEAAVHKLDQIIRASDRAMVLVRQLLTFSRRETMHPEAVDPVALTTQLTKMIKRLLGEHIEIVLNVHDTPPSVYADPGQLEQVLMNLCVNSRDAMPGGGRIVIDVASRTLDENWCRTHPDIMPGEYVCLSVSDTGCGMSPELCERVFEPFFTTKPEGKGTGLGLATVYAIVRRHGGHIDVYSQEGLGATFRVFVPVAPSECPAADGGDPAAAALPGGTETVLLAEDGDLVREMTQSILEEAGYTVITACDGEEAVVLFGEHAGDIDLLVLDVIMPRRNGRDVYEAVSSRRRGLPVLFISGYSSDLLESDYLLSVPGDILQKPYTEPELLQRIRTLLDRS